MDNPSLTDYLDFLARPASYAEPTGAVEIRQTHISIVAITDHFVYKLKKPVRLDFLDFSSPKRRLHFCREEIRLNQRLSPHLYVALLPLYYHHGQLQFQPEGRIVNYVIQMHRLSEPGLLVNQIKRSDFQPADLDLLIKTLVRFYRRLKPTLGISVFGDARYLRRTIREVTQAFEHLESVGMPASARHLLNQYLFGFLKKYQGVFRHRVESKRIVEGHGDLRCEHIHLDKGMVTIYDCLEFTLRLRCVDWLNDIAFLLMDLDYRHCHRYSRYLESALLNTMETEDVSGLLTFYKTYRACVRAKVNSLKALEDEIPPAEQEVSREKARRYFQLAVRYAMLGTEPTIVVCLGGVASGKTTLAATLSTWTGLPHLNSDVIRKQLAGLDSLTRLPDQERSRLYSAKMTGQVYAELHRQAFSEIEWAGAVVLDATYRQPRHLQKLADSCRQHGIRLMVLETRAANTLVLQRLHSRETEPTVSDMRLADYDADLFRVNYSVKSIAELVLIVDTSRPVATVVEQTVIPWLIKNERKGAPPVPSA